MYRIPKELDLSSAVGELISQFCVGEFDLQFALGGVHFAIQSEIRILKAEKQIGLWTADGWPTQAFYQCLNIKVSNIEVVNDKEIVIYFENDLSMHIFDNSDQYESMQIQIDGDDHLWVI